MTARHSAYAQALRRAGGMEAGSVGDDSASATAEPRPRSRFEQVFAQEWDEIAFDEQPTSAHRAPDVPSPPHAGHSPVDEAPVPVPQTFADTALPRPEPESAPTDVPRAPATGSSAGEEGNAGRNDGSEPSSPSARWNARVPADDLPPVADAAPPSGPSVLTPAPPLPRSTSTRAPFADGVSTAAVPAVEGPRHDAPATASTTADFDVVTAEPLPLPLPPDPGPPTAEAPTVPAPVVVEIGRVEVRIDAGAPPAPAQGHRERTRTWPSLEEYLASGANGVTGREVP